MLTLLKGLKCFSPQYLGIKDILIARDRIYKIFDTTEKVSTDLVENIYDCSGLYAFPGLIDQHAHIIGGGGEAGFASRLPEIDFKDIIVAGVTTVAGLLGTDNQTKELKALLAKARALQLQGLTTFIYSGSYTLPAVTLTGSVASDLVLIDKVIGVGEVAISDHRSSQPDIKDILHLASQTHVGGLVSGKAGVVHIHLGDGKDGLGLLNQVVENSDLPKSMFVPTHVNRNQRLFEQAIEYCRAGGYIDLTAGEEEGIAVPDAIAQLLSAGVDLSRVTVSSDANGSSPSGQLATINRLYSDIIDCIKLKNISIDTAFGLVTENVAKALKLYPQKGLIEPNCDADIIITNEKFEIIMVFSRGKLLLNTKP